MIIALWAIPSILYILVITKLHAVYVPSLGGCVILSNFRISSIAYTNHLCVTFLTTSAAYLHYKIIHVKSYICELHQCGMD